MKNIGYFWLLVVLVLSGCDADPHSKSTPINPQASRPMDTAIMADNPREKFSTVQKGFQLYRVNCASCHGAQGQGAPNWQQAGPNGKQPAPPLNGTGHAWHHPMPVLVSTIKNGTQGIGGSMPAWKDKLTEPEIMAIIAWFQSRWPDELYRAWARMDRSASK